MQADRARLNRQAQQGEATSRDAAREGKAQGQQMAVEVRMPAYSESMQEADVVGWLVAPGDRVEKGDPIAEIETDKATGELESPTSGTISEILVAEGSQGVKVGELLALIEPADESTEENADEGATEAGSRDATQPSPGSELNLRSDPVTAARSPAKTPAPPQPDAARNADPIARTTAHRVPATALARRLADQAGLDLSTISGSGASGRVLKVDVESLSRADGRTQQNPADPRDRGQDGNAQQSRAAPRDRGQQVPVPPQLLLRVECRVDTASTACERLSEREPDTPIPLLALIVRAAAGALREVPEANTAWIDDELVPLDGSTVALGLPSGRGGDPLLVRNAAQKGLGVLAGELAAGAESAADETQTGPAALAIVDVGDENIESIQLSVVPPSVCVLGTGALVERPVAVDGKLEVASVITCTLAADSRALSPKTAARLLSAFKLRMEDPAEMILY